ncbi:hypothetical protein K2173_000885 [Erythroxylum novogranatense]|uniref:RNase H type-1 domain-containing protein n=1 Tax=Erythroxylum novogranatense TaxID=1862640 RepID=A0AAV8TT53_9ROSI|nr:hypothetical protein K2173_000885 [Erythroxylum novogranatense]
MLELMRIAYFALCKKLWILYSYINCRDWNVLKPTAASLQQIGGQQGIESGIINLDNSHWQAFIDAATFQQEDFTGFAVILEDPEGGFIKAISGYQEGVKSAAMAEAIALRQALLHAKSHFHDEDCQHLFLALSSHSLDVSKLGLIVKRLFAYS